MPVSELIQPERLLNEFSPGEPYLIGVSGGRDSVALLHQLVSSGYHRLIVCHVNHRLRGRSSDADVRFVEKLAAKYNLDFTSCAVAVKTVAKRRKLSIEAAARSARYEFFAQIARRRRCRTIFLAHHADDLVETFLINLFRGAGSAGLGSIRALSKHRIGEVTLDVVRPMLAVWRTDIDSYVKRHRLAFREDASNRELTPLRNRVRHSILPYLEKSAGRGIRSNIWRTAVILAEEEDFFAELVPKINGDIGLKTLRKMAVALQRRTLHTWLRSANIPD
ncbi:MAG TPA: tRNA lysidine(34) synthetase TilS, partial [Chthoniobacterales bacterium]|nr:tRNA lysidine(34) synthetase TilS [Chthoniobacterales bacterium]